MTYADLEKKRRYKRAWELKNKEKVREQNRINKRKQRKRRRDEINANQRRHYQRNRSVEARKQNDRRIKRAPHRGLRKAIRDLTSLSLLNSSGDVLLSAMNSMVPPEGSGRTLGEYSAQGIRQLTKSLCDVVMTKAAVVRQIYSISRDEI